jgi:hypothetical protein
VTTDQQQRRGQRPTASTDSAEDLSFTPDELTALLQQASQLDARKVEQSHPVSLADALQTARDLGIPEEHVLMAAEDLKRSKVKVARRRHALVSRRNAFIRFLFITLSVSIGMLLMSGLHTALVIFAAMSIPLLLLGSRWIMARIDPTEGGHSGPEPGVCRVCGRTAWNPNATFCTLHKI